MARVEDVMDNVTWLAVKDERCRGEVEGILVAKGPGMAGFRQDTVRGIRVTVYCVRASPACR